MLAINEIKNILPQGEPFIFIDSVVEIEKGKRLTAAKNITANEWTVEGIFPETLLIEAASQSAIVLHQISLVKNGEKVGYMLTRTKVQFEGQAAIGDQVLFDVVATKMMKKLGIMDIGISVKDGKKLGTVQIYYSVTDEGKR